jgi:hypothetical protein
MSILIYQLGTDIIDMKMSIQITYGKRRHGCFS